MDIDKLTKLVKLANHNPNDHEANSAARMVCKMIEDAKFRFVDSLGDTIKEDKIPGMGTPPRAKRQDAPRPDREQRSEEFWKMWNEYTRRRDRDNPFERAYYDFYGGEDPFRTPPRERKKQTDQYVCITCNKISTVPAGARVPDDSRCPECADKLKYSKEWKNQERQFKCRDCGVEVVTRFDGPDDQFICFICRIKK